MKWSSSSVVSGSSIFVLLAPLIEERRTRRFPLGMFSEGEDDALLQSVSCWSDERWISSQGRWRPGRIKTRMPKKNSRWTSRNKQHSWQVDRMKRWIVLITMSPEWREKSGGQISLLSRIIFFTLICRSVIWINLEMFVFVHYWLEQVMGYFVNRLTWMWSSSIKMKTSSPRLCVTNYYSRQLIFDLFNLLNRCAPVTNILISSLRLPKPE